METGRGTGRYDPEVEMALKKKISFRATQKKRQELLKVAKKKHYQSICFLQRLLNDKE